MKQDILGYMTIYCSPVILAINIYKMSVKHRTGQPFQVTNVHQSANFKTCCIYLKFVAECYLSIMMKYDVPYYVYKAVSGQFCSPFYKFCALLCLTDVLLFAKEQ